MFVSNFDCYVPRAMPLHLNDYSIPPFSMIDDTASMLFEYIVSCITNLIVEFLKKMKLG